MELLRSIFEGTYANAKTGDPSFHAYAAAVNVATEFAAQALDILELIPFNNQLADSHEDYMPSYPPMSPATSAFFADWMVLDARDFMTGATLGELLMHYLQQVGKYAPSNWSKIEREVLTPPRDEDTLRAWAKQLGIKQGSDDWLKFFDYAAVDAGRIPDHVIKDEELVKILPAFFRTLSGQKPSEEELENLIKLLRER